MFSNARSVPADFWVDTNLKSTWKCIHLQQFLATNVGECSIQINIWKGTALMFTRQMMKNNGVVTNVARVLSVLQNWRSTWTLTLKLSPTCVLNVENIFQMWATINLTQENFIQNTLRLERQKVRECDNKCSITRSSKDEYSTGSNNHLRSKDLFRSLSSIGQKILMILPT